MFGSTFLAGCSAVLRTLEGLLVPAATSSTPARNFYRNSRATNKHNSVSDPAPAVPVVEKAEEEDSLECPPSPPVSDSSSVFSQSSSDLFDSDTECDEEEKLDAPLPARSRAFALKLAALHFWLSRSDLSPADRAHVRSFGIRMIESEETYEIQYEQSQLNVKAAKFVEREDVRNERLRERLSRALDDFAREQRQAAELACLPEAEQSPDDDSVARLYWPAQSHSRTISSAVALIASTDSHTISLSRARSFLCGSPSSSRRAPTPRERPDRSLGKSESLLRSTLDGSVRPAYRAYKRREQHAQAMARIASVSRPVDVPPRSCSGSGAVSEVQRPSPRKFSGIPLENPSATPSKAIGLGRPPVLAKSTPTPRSRIPIPIATPIKTPTPTPTPTPSCEGPARRVRKSYGAIEQRRPPFRV